MNVLIIASNRTLTLSLVRALSGAKIKAHVLANGSYPVVGSLSNCLSVRKYDNHLLEQTNCSLADYADRMADVLDCAVVMPSGIEAVKYLAANKGRIQSAKVIPLPPADSVSMLNDKWEFQKFARSAGVATVPSELIVSGSSLAPTDRTYPMILKPTDWDGSRGIHVVKSDSDLKEHFDRLQLAGMLPVMVQEYVHGDDMSVSVVAEHGVIKASAVHTWVGKDKDVQYISDGEALESTGRLIAASKYHGLANFDFRRDSQSRTLYAIECNPRPWASIHIAMCAGINFAELAIESAFGRAIPEVAPPSDLFIHPERALVQLLLGKIRSKDLTPATLNGLALNRSEPKASITRFLQKHMPYFNEITEAFQGHSASIPVSVRTSEAVHTV